MLHNARTIVRQTVEMLGYALAGEWGCTSWDNLWHYLRWQAAYLGVDLRP